MLIRFGYDLTFVSSRPVQILCLLDAHRDHLADIVWSGRLETTPHVESTLFNDAFGNEVRRLTAPTGESRISRDAMIHCEGLPQENAPAAAQLEVADLPADVLAYLFGSRYCETDKLGAVAWQLFGQTPPGWIRVQAICNFVHAHLTFAYRHARLTRTVFEAYEERVGVFRDFAHLAVAFCRCMNIPARYANNFLGDIGIPPDPAPMDYNAWFEAYLGGRWHVFDARFNMPRIGRITVVRGREG